MRGAETQPRSGDQPVRWLLVHDLHDLSAPWLATQWRERLGERAAELLVLPAPALTLCTRWQLQVRGPSTQARLHVALGKGVETHEYDIRSELLLGVLHRPWSAWVADTAPERDYLVQERQALLLTWLHSLGRRCVNRPVADALAGPAWSTAQWRWQAQRCQMPVLRWPDPQPGVFPLLRLLVVGEQCFSVNGAMLGKAWHAAARLLADTAGCGLLGIYLVANSDGRWSFAQASAQPDLRPAGAVAAQALADTLGMPSVQRAATPTGGGCN